MKEITDLTVTQVRVFAVDTIPFRRMGTKSCTDRIKNDFRINEVRTDLVSPGVGSIVFEIGELEQEGSTIVTNRIVVEPRRIILDVAGTSRQASQVYALLLKSMESTTGMNLTKLRSPMIVSETTQCVAALEFPFDSLLADSFTRFIHDSVTKTASTKIAKASLTPLVLEFQVNYDVKAKTLIEHKISLSPKRLTIAPRGSTPLEQKRYFTSSPFDSDTHLRLLQDLERALAQKHPG